MTIKPNLNRAMRAFFGELADFELADDEALTIAGMSYPECSGEANGSVVLERCPDAGHASGTVLRRLGPACELHVAIVKSDWPLNTPAGPGAIVGSWEMREWTSAEKILGCPLWAVRGSRPDELLVLSRVYPAGDNLCCQATVRYPSRYHELGVATIEKVLRGYIDPRHC